MKLIRWLTKVIPAPLSWREHPSRALWLTLPLMILALSLNELVGTFYGQSRATLVWHQTASYVLTALGPVVPLIAHLF